MSKTYIPGAVTVVQHTSKYLNRWQSKLVQGATTEQTTALAELLVCVAKFLQVWLKPPPIN